MGARGAQLLAHIDVVLQVVLGPVRVVDVAGIADRTLADLVVLDHRIHRDAHVLHPVEAVEDAEDIDPGGGGHTHEFLHHIVGIIGIADAVRGTQQHLGHQVRHRGAQVAQALPGTFLQEAVGHVEGGTAPAFDGEKLRQVGGIGGRHLDHVDGPHPRGEQRLVPVAHGGVGDQQVPLLLHPVGHRLRALLLQQVARAHHRLGAQFRRARILDAGMRTRVALGLGMSVDGDVGDIGQHLGAAVAALEEVEELRRLVDEFRVIGVVQEGRVFEQVLDEGDVGGDPANAELAQGPVHPGDGGLGRLRLGGDLHQQAVVVARDHPARIGGAAVKPDAHAGRLAKGGDPAIIGDEVVLRILGGDPGLQRVAGQLHVVLRGLAGGLGDGLAFGDQDLRLHDVDAGDLFGDGMFDLHARVHLDEVELARRPYPSGIRRCPRIRSSTCLQIA